MSSKRKVTFSPLAGSETPDDRKQGDRPVFPRLDQAKVEQRLLELQRQLDDAQKMLIVTESATPSEISTATSSVKYYTATLSAYKAKVAAYDAAVEKTLLSPLPHAPMSSEENDALLTWVKRFEGYSLDRLMDVWGRTRLQAYDAIVSTHSPDFVNSPEFSLKLRETIHHVEALAELVRSAKANVADGEVKDEDQIDLGDAAEREISDALSKEENPFSRRAGEIPLGSRFHRPSERATSSSFSDLMAFEDIDSPALPPPSSVSIKMPAPMSGVGPLIQFEVDSAIMTWDTAIHLLRQVNKSHKGKYPIRERLCELMSSSQLTIHSETFWTDLSEALTALVETERLKREADSKEAPPAGRMRRRAQLKIRTLEFLNAQLDGDRAARDKCVSFYRSDDLLSDRLVISDRKCFRILFRPTALSKPGVQAELTIRGKRFVGEIFPSTTPPGITSLPVKDVSLFIGHLAATSCTIHGDQFDMTHPECVTASGTPILCVDIYGRRISKHTKRAVQNLIDEIERPGMSGSSVTGFLWDIGGVRHALSYPLGRVAIPLTSDGNFLTIQLVKPVSIDTLSKAGKLIMPTIESTGSIDGMYFTINSQLVLPPLVKYLSNIRYATVHRNRATVTVGRGELGVIFVPMITRYIQNDMMLLEGSLMGAKNKPSWAQSNDLLTSFMKANLLISFVFWYVARNSFFPSLRLRSPSGLMKEFGRRESVTAFELMCECDSVSALRSVMWKLAPMLEWDKYVPRLN